MSDISRQPLSDKETAGVRPQCTAIVRLSCAVYHNSAVEAGGLPVNGTARTIKQVQIIKAVNAMKVSGGASTKPGAESTWAPLE